MQELALQYLSRWLMLKKLIILISRVAVFNSVVAQFSSAPVYIQTFGQGDISQDTRGPALKRGQTDFNYTTDLCPQPGSYTITRLVDVHGCFNEEWIPLQRHTVNDYGMFMVVNNMSSPKNRIVMRTKRQSFCSKFIIVWDNLFLKQETGQKNGMELSKALSNLQVFLCGHWIIMMHQIKEYH